eukprot:CAMPEP_0198109870 /NCGR_PEP_ID=MMETSP1442-20131203/1908_1 /TAXON_ID= /ORGANISM="Craspedostauros australis, Strain CCMP3328" /LENGTH=229 /DNA_ID=CAMNT_0043765703 /DNA_START=143 /DNA_END=832 /DNA_ORIENTATION=+
MKLIQSIALAALASAAVAAPSLRDADVKVELDEKLALSADEILLEDFANPMHTWKQMNDPVMGGKSTGSFTIEDGVGKFVGKVVDVPFLHAPGFIQARTIDNEIFPDVSGCSGLSFLIKSNVDYAGYRVSFGKDKPPHGRMHAFGYKSDLANYPSGDFGEVVFAFSDFTDYWDDATGDAIVTCAQDSQYCPSTKALMNLKTMAVWGEGVAGDVSLDIKTIKAVGCASTV